MRLPLKTDKRRRCALGELMGVGKRLGLAEEAPSISFLAASGMRSSCFLERISGSGRQYGASSIRFPSFKQSSNL